MTDPRPLTAEDEAFQRRTHEYPRHLAFSECIVCRLLATLDAERDKWDSLSARAIVAWAAAARASDTVLREAAEWAAFALSLALGAEGANRAWLDEAMGASDALRAALASPEEQS